MLLCKHGTGYRYGFGTTENEISGQRSDKRRSAKALYDLPSLFEGRRTFQMSYGRYVDDEKFRVFATIHLSPFGSMGTTWGTSKRGETMILIP
jgi:hypothetical protein